MHFDMDADFYTQLKVFYNEGYAGTVWEETSNYQYGDTSIYKFGGKSMYLDAQYTHSHGNRFGISDLPLGDYTIEFWLYKDAISWGSDSAFMNPAISWYADGPTFTRLIGVNNADPGNICIGCDFSSEDYMFQNKIHYNTSLSRYWDTNYECYVYSCANNTWCHVALTYAIQTNRATLYLAGQRVFEFSPRKEAEGSPGITFGNGSFGIYMHIDEIRVVERIEYTGQNIIVPTSKFLY